MINKYLKLFAIASLALALSAPVFAADDDEGDDPPDRVARLAYLQGTVSMQPGGTDDWTDAALNRPLTTGDKLWVDRSSRAELQSGSANIHVDQGTGFSFLELSDDVLQMRVTDGAINVNVRRLRDGEVIEVDTPTTAVTITRAGEYHIEVVDDGANTIVKTYAGECEVADNNRHITRVRARQQVSVAGDQDAVIARGTFEPRDDFDAWSNDRNQRYVRSASARYVDPDVIGYADLDDQGDWRSEREYGNVWYPSHVAVDWSPYRYGHWTWVAPWGWTWVDDASWGFAPFHYGRWAFVRNRWGWIPGPLRVRAVYAPAMVAWVGSPGLNISVSIGSGIGWFPLGPREVYVPGYHCSPRHLQNVNYANTVIVNRNVINNVYVNRGTPINHIYGRNPRAVTVVQRDTFVGARPVHNHMVAVKEGDLRNWRTENRTPSIAPDRASALGPRWNANAAGNIRHGRDREVVALHTPPSRTSFANEQQAIRANNDRPVTRNELWRNNRDNRDSRERRTDVRTLDVSGNRAQTNVNSQNEPRPAMPMRDDLRRRTRDRPPQAEQRDTNSENNSRGNGRNRGNDAGERINVAPPVQPAAQPQIDPNARNRDAERRDNSIRDNDTRRFDRGSRFRVDPRPSARPEAAPEINQEKVNQENRAEAQRQENLRRENSARENLNQRRNDARFEPRRSQNPEPAMQNREAQPPVVNQPERQERRIERPQVERRVERPAPPPQAAPPPQPQAAPAPQPRVERQEREERGDERRRDHGRREDR